MGHIELDADQWAAVKRMVEEPTRAALNASQYGTGKTVVTVEVAEGIGALVKLIVAPLFTKYSWESSIKGQYPSAQVSFINSSKSGKQALADLLEGVEGWYIIGREYFASKSVAPLIAKASSKIDFLAYDECARWANYKSQGYKIMRTMKPGYRMALSATPAANKFSGLFAITQWLWPNLDGHRSFWRFVSDWGLTEEDYFGGVQVIGEKDPGAFVAHLPCYIRVEKDFGEYYEETIEVDLSPKERAIYDKFEKHLIVWLKENYLVTNFPMTKRLRLRQMTLGEVSYDADTDNVYFADDMKSTKYETLLAYIKENPGEPMIIFTHSAKFAHVVAWKLIEDGYKALPWSGEVDEDVRQEAKKQFEEGNFDFIVATIASIGEGVDGLQHRARTMVWLSRDDNNMLNMQAFRRLYRRGQGKTVRSIDIVARNTYDSGQLSGLVRQTLDMNALLKRKEKEPV